VFWIKKTIKKRDDRRAGVDEELPRVEVFE
jgi:hypothetical protein